VIGVFIFKILILFIINGRKSSCFLGRFGASIRSSFGKYSLDLCLITRFAIFDGIIVSLVSEMHTLPSVARLRGAIRSAVQSRIVHVLREHHSWAGEQRVL